jgi:hypothetical protein
MRTHATSITSLPPSPDEERHSRVVKYTVAMAIRLVCVLACFFVHGWWVLLPLTLAVVLPYLAVVIANVNPTQTGGSVERPGSLVRLRDQRP